MLYMDYEISHTVMVGNPSTMVIALSLSGCGRGHAGDRSHGTTRVVLHTPLLFRPRAYSLLCKVSGHELINMPKRIVSFNAEVAMRLHLHRPLR